VEAGELIAGRYALELQLGEGGMAVVWRAHDRTLERPVAIKFLLSGDPRKRAALSERFLREARIAAAVRHRNVIQILDFGTHEDCPYIIMEALEGDTMADRFERGERFGFREVIDIAVDCLDGLAAVHDAGIVHRDLKPENIFLVHERSTRYAKLLDFGISRSTEGDRRSAVTTSDGRIIGTPEYMSPEQARGVMDIDARTDIYSMGVVMYEALTGQAPYESPQIGDLLIKVVAGGAAPVDSLVPGVGAQVSQLVKKAMNVDPAFRFESAIAMRDALQSALHSTLASDAPGPTLPRTRNTRRGSTTAGATGAGAMPMAAAELARDAAESAARVTRRSPLLLLTLAVLTGAGVVGAGVTLRSNLRDETKDPRAASSRYIVVQAASPAQNGAVASGPKPSVPVAAVALVAASESPALEGVAPALRSRPPKASTKAQPAAVKVAPNPMAQLAQMFERQKIGVVHCLDRNPGEVTANAQMSVRMSLDAAGSVQRADVMPAQLASSSLGKCIASAVGQMRFGPQPGPVTIRVPLTARRE
jgi:serine/threonine-protein kinase